MLSAAAAVLLAQPMAVRADVTINSATTTPLATTASGNITIEPTGAISVKNNGAVLTLDSNNFINSSGQISNLDNSGSIGLLIDTSDHDVVAASPGLVSLNSITLAGEGNSRTGVFVTGGKTYFGNITISNTAALNAGLASATLLVEGSSSYAYRQSQDTRVDGDISFGGSITGTPGSGTNTAGNTLFLFDGEVNGNVYFDSSLAASSNGQNARGIAVLGGIHACANSNRSAAQLAAGYTCPRATARVRAPSSMPAVSLPSARCSSTPGARIRSWKAARCCSSEAASMAASTTPAPPPRRAASTPPCSAAAASTAMPC